VWANITPSRSINMNFLQVDDQWIN
jgi:hypothetical protein